MKFLFFFYTSDPLWSVRRSIFSVIIEPCVSFQNLSSSCWIKLGWISFIRHLSKEHTNLTIVLNLNTVHEWSKFTVVFPTRLVAAKDYGLLLWFLFSGKSLVFSIAFNEAKMQVPQRHQAFFFQITVLK